MPSKYHGHEDMMYRTLRCGIVHAMSFDDELNEDNSSFLQKQPKGVQGFSELAITHAHQYDTLCAGAQLKKDQNGMYVLVADILCDDVGKAINNMFSDQCARDNCARFILCQRPISQLQIQGNGLVQGCSVSFPTVAVLPLSASAPFNPNQYSHQS